MLCSAVLHWTYSYSGLVCACDDILLTHLPVQYSLPPPVMDVMTGDPCIYVWDLHIEEAFHRKGVGKHLMTLLSLIGTREKMQHLCVPVQMFDEQAQQWLESIKGFAPDKTLKKLIKFDSEMEVRTCFSVEDCNFLWINLAVVWCGVCGAGV